MELFEAILNRRTIKDFNAAPVGEELLRRVLNAGLWAQNHRMTQPWRFTILGPETKAALASINAELKTGSVPGADPSTLEKMTGDAKAKILSKPAVVVVSQRFGGDEEQRLEDYAAVCCAVQNIQLAAWAEGLGMQWSTGKLIRHAATYALLKIDTGEEQITGLLYFGFPANVPEAHPRKPLDEVLRHLP